MCDGTIETTITTEKETGFTRNRTDLLAKNGLRLLNGEGKIAWNDLFYVNQAYLSYKDNKKIYYCDTYIIGQVVPLLNHPGDLKNYNLLSNEARIIKLKYDHVSGEFLGLVEGISYLTVRDDKHFLDYGCNKENSKILYSTQKMKIPNSFYSTIFNRDRIQFETGSFSETEFSNVFIFLPATTDRVEDINKYMGSVNLLQSTLNFQSLVTILILRSSIMLILKKKKLENLFWKCLKVLPIWVIKIYKGIPMVY